MDVKNLVRELKQKMDAGVDSAIPEDTLKIFEFIQQFSLKKDDLKEEMEGKDNTMQVEITDTGKNTGCVGTMTSWNSGKEWPACRPISPGLPPSRLPWSFLGRPPPKVPS